MGDLNATTKFWFEQDNTSYEGSDLNGLMTQYSLTQIIHEPSQKNCLIEVTFPNKWKKAHVVPIHKKNDDKQILTNYRPVSLPSVCRKTLERLKYNSM